MGNRVIVGVRKRLSWAVLAVALGASGPVACGDDLSQTLGPNPPAAGGSAGATDVSGQGGEAPIANTGGTMTVPPGDLVCGKDDDCTDNEKPVCDQVLGCVACQYDWDCPASHRCRDNECFAKRSCTSSDQCQDDAEHAVCDDVQQVCVGCREDSHCGAGERCEASECVTFEACTNSRDCSSGKVCDRVVGACVACVVDGDCGDGNACVKNACVPTCASDKDCLGIGLLCDQNVGRCVECLGHADCPAQYFCGPGKSCSLDVCETGQTRCETEHQLATCAEVGDGFATSSCDGASRCVEADLTASCVPLVCTPSTTICSADGAAVEHCSADGLAVETPEPCLEGKACLSGACVDVICVPDAFRCNGTALYQCNANGTKETLADLCSGDFGSVCDAESGTCKDSVCYPGASTCSGNVVSVCAEDGMSTLPGTNCATSNQACHQGSCKDVVCEDDYICEGATLRRCLDNGTRLSTIKDCGFETLCDAGAAKCITPICTPGAFVCDGDVATRCKPDGSGYIAGGTDCGASNLVCDGGGCLAKVCTAGSYFCSGGSPQYCGESGATYSPSDACSASEYCVDGSYYCQFDKCTAGAAVCNGNVATTCASDGSGPVAGGTDCAATSQVCEAGACQAVVCTSGALTCQGEAVYQCQANGTGTQLYDSCTVSEYCDASGETPACMPDLCTAGTLGCNGEVVSTCDANGGSWTSPGANCKATNQVCILGGTCAVEEVATQGAITSTKSVSSTQLLAFRVLTARKLTKIELQGSFAGLQKLTWVVYEKRVGSEMYDLAYQKVTSQTMPALGALQSPALDFQLVAGKSYAVGLLVSATATVYYSTSAQLVAKAAFITGSFAATISGGASPPTSAVPASTTSRTYIKLTTTGG